ncbi:MAG TPA: hypothetical protein VFZ25_03625 [Chloroflexota bacterium]|nr:hypothetical protein [Chloroflexota bacterium]
MPGFWDQAKKAASRVGAEAEKQATVAKLNVEINQTHGRIKDKLADMGQAALQLYRNGTIDHADLEPFAVEIDNLERHVKELETQIAEARAAQAPEG